MSRRCILCSDTNGKVVNNRDGFKLKDVPAECIEHILSKDLDVDQSGFVGDRSDVQKFENFGISLKAKDIVDYVFGEHILGKQSEFFGPPCFTLKLFF